MPVNHRPYRYGPHQGGDLSSIVFFQKPHHRHHTFPCRLNKIIWSESSHETFEFPKKYIEAVNIIKKLNNKELIKSTGKGRNTEYILK